MMRSTLVPVLTALLCLTACDRKGARAADFDSATAVALKPPIGAPTLPPGASSVARISSFDVGHQLAKDNSLVGGAGGQFATTDSIMVTVRADHVTAQDHISVRLRTGNHTVDSSNVVAPAADSTGSSVVGFRFRSAKGWAKGAYQLEVFLGAASQGVKDFKIAQ